MRIVDLHVPTIRRSLELNPDLRSLAATQAKRTAGSDLRYSATGAGCNRRRNHNETPQHRRIVFNVVQTRNLAIANRSRVSCAHNTSRASIVTP